MFHSTVAMAGAGRNCFAIIEQARTSNLIRSSHLNELSAAVRAHTSARATTLAALGRMRASESRIPDQNLSKQFESRDRRAVQRPTTKLVCSHVTAAVLHCVESKSPFASSWGTYSQTGKNRQASNVVRLTTNHIHSTTTTTCGMKLSRHSLSGNGHNMQLLSRQTCCCRLASRDNKTRATIEVVNAMVDLP